jgi:hypothetical protein
MGKEKFRELDENKKNTSHHSDFGLTLATLQYDLAVIGKSIQLCEPGHDFTGLVTLQ